mmetsp:Transcript_6555/g.14234  ORF Transcript_6555/g.14234 Transcript_6555/m.14234 type:complete len:307 (-) Transcript_6555:1185-2105(-)
MPAEVAATPALAAGAGLCCEGRHLFCTSSSSSGGGGNSSSGSRVPSCKSSNLELVQVDFDFWCCSAAALTTPVRRGVVRWAGTAIASRWHSAHAHPHAHAAHAAHAHTHPHAPGRGTLPGRLAPTEGARWWCHATWWWWSSPLVLDLASVLPSMLSTVLSSIWHVGPSVYHLHHELFRMLDLVGFPRDEHWTRISSFRVDFDPRPAFPLQADDGFSTLADNPSHECIRKLKAVLNMALALADPSSFFVSFRECLYHLLGFSDLLSCAHQSYPALQFALLDRDLGSALHPDLCNRSSFRTNDAPCGN